MQADFLNRIGRYEIIGELGAGSMSRVYLAHDPNLDRKVAVKVVLRGFSLDAREQTELERRFLLEARAAGKLSHPGIVRVYDAATDRETGVPYIAMEWVVGGSLREVIEDRPRIAASDLLGLLSQVARALDYAHRSGRVHRDIKPSNILLTTEGVAKVSDFGVAKIMSESHTISGQVLGTPAYMSPEQIKDEPVDGRSDLFSLGAVLYQCVSGITPFGGDTLVQIVYKILNVDPRPLQLPDSPAWQHLAQIVDRALKKNAGARFQTGSEFAEELDRARSQLDGQYFADLFQQADQPSSQTPPDTVAVRPLVAGSNRPAVAGGPTETIQLNVAEAGTRAANPAAAGEMAPSAVDTVATSATDPVRPRTISHRLGLAASLILAAALCGISWMSWLGSRKGPTLEGGAPTARPVSRFDSPSAGDPPARSVPQHQPLRFPSEPPPDPDWSAADAAQSRAGDRGSSEWSRASSVASPERRVDAEDSVEQTATSTPPGIVRQPTPSSVQPLTPVTILYRHRGGLAYLTVRIDGMRVWSQQIQPVVGRFRKLAGFEARAVVPVPSGVHTMEVQLTDTERNIDATGTIRSRYTNGQRRTLRADLDPDVNEMQLRWKE